MKRREIHLLGIDEFIVRRGSQIINKVNEKRVGGSVVSE